MRVFANQYCFIVVPHRAYERQGFQKLGGGICPIVFPTVQYLGGCVPRSFVAQFYKVEPILRNTRLPKIWGGAINALLCPPPLIFFGGTCPPVSPTHRLTPMHFKIMVTRRVLFSVSGSVYD